MEINVYRFGRNGDGQGEMSRQLKLFIGRRELGRVEKYEVFDTSKKILQTDRPITSLQNRKHITYFEIYKILQKYCYRCNSVPSRVVSQNEFILRVCNQQNGTDKPVTSHKRIGCQSSQLSCPYFLHNE